MLYLSEAFTLTLKRQAFELTLRLDACNTWTVIHLPQGAHTSHLRTLSKINHLQPSFEDRPEAFRPG
jgi:hypothetical protein